LPGAVAGMFKKIVVIDLHCIYPFFLFGLHFASRLATYLEYLEWPVDEAARGTVVPVTMGDLFLDFVFATAQMVPVKRIVGTRDCDVDYVVPQTQLESTSFTNMLRTFIEAVDQLSHCAARELLPGMKQQKHSDFLFKDGKRLLHKSLQFGPRSLVCAKAVFEFKQSILDDYANISVFPGRQFFLHLPLATLQAASVPADIPQWDYCSWWRVRKSMHVNPDTKHLAKRRVLSDLADCQFR
jgi:hypothetical protein